MERMDSGSGEPAFERGRLARFISDNEGRIRAMAREKLTLRSRTWTDSEDVVSSVYLRLDKLLQQGKLRYDDLDDLWPLIKIIAERRAIDRNRLAKNMERLLIDEPDHMDLTSAIANDPEEDATDLVLRLLSRVRTSVDRQLLILMLRGTRSHVAGELLGVTPEAARQRWSRLRKDLAIHLREEYRPRA